MALKTNLKMEINLAAKELEKCGQVALSCDEKSLGHVKSYRCSFCKRVFSSAQALGGHMNIHRKDKAKLKELCGDNILSLNIATNDPSHDQSPATANDELIQLQSKEEKSCSKKKPIEELSSIPKEGVDDLLQLSLFSDTTSTSTYEEVSDCIIGRHAGENIPTSPGASRIELDLELRLGPERHESLAKG